MGKKYLRIVNRGSCPREFLMYIGAGSKRSRMSDPSQGGWFGSGAKFVPVAALNLGLEIHVASTDAQGSYLLSYDVSSLEIPASPELGIEGGAQTIIMMRLDDGPPISMMAVKDAFPNWSRPIGSDRMKSFRVLREYLRNAKDADPEGPHLSTTARPMKAPRGTTVVYIEKNEEIDSMLASADRYFKYISNSKPLISFSRLGEMYDKSERGVTRLFSLGTLAYCSRELTETTVFDYSLDRKGLVSEERVFDDLTGVKRDIAVMMANIPNAETAHYLLHQMEAGEAEFEASSLVHLPTKAVIHSMAHWVEGWNRNYGSDAVLASESRINDRVAYLHGKRAVHVRQHQLRWFLKRCGVPEASDLLSQPLTDYQVVEPTAEEKARLDAIMPKLLTIYPEMKDMPISVFTPLTEERKRWAGFTLGRDGRFTDVFLQRGLAFASNWELVETLSHEFLHVKFQALDLTEEFQRASDQARTALLMRVLDIEDDRPPPPPPPPSMETLDLDLETLLRDMDKNKI